MSDEDWDPVLLYSVILCVLALTGLAPLAMACSCCDLDVPADARDDPHDSLLSIYRSMLYPGFPYTSSTALYYSLHPFPLHM